MKKKFVAMSAAGALLVAAVGFLSWPADAPEAEIVAGVEPSEGAEALELERSVQALSYEVKAMRKQIEKPPVAEEKQEPIAETREPPLTPEEHTQVLESVFTGEARDVAWASALEAEIAGVFTTGKIEGRLIAAECRSTICRISIESIGEAPDRMISDVLHTSVFAAGTGMFHFDPRSGELRMYFGKLKAS